MALTRKRIRAIVELARRGVDGERDNAREICKTYGIDWDSPEYEFNSNKESGHNEGTTPKRPGRKAKPTQSKPDLTHGWREVNYKPHFHVNIMFSRGAAALDILPLFEKMAEKYAIDCINKVNNSGQVFRKGGFEFGYLIFWGTSKEAMEVDNLLESGIADFMLELYATYERLSPGVSNLSLYNKKTEYKYPHPGEGCESVYNRTISDGMYQGLLSLFKRGF